MQIIVVYVSGQMYGIDISLIRDISRVPVLTDLPTRGGDKPEGIHNFRGQVIPVYDLAKLLNLGQTGQDRKLLVAELPARVIGLIVSDVEEVICIDDDEIQSVPFAEIVLGAALIENKLISILDIPKLV